MHATMSRAARAWRWVPLGVWLLAACGSSLPSTRGNTMPLAGEGKACGGRFDVRCASGLVCDLGVPGTQLDQGGVCKRPAP